MYILGNDIDMKAKISKWGNSLGLRIPQAFAELLDLNNGDEVQLKLKNHTLTITPIAEEEAYLEKAKKLAKKINIKELSSRVTPENMPDIEDDGPVGREIW